MFHASMRSQNAAMSAAVAPGSELRRTASSSAIGRRLPGPTAPREEAERLGVRLRTAGIADRGRALVESRPIRMDDEPAGEEPLGRQARGDALRVDVLDLVHGGQPSTSQATDVDAVAALLR
jgi:hypothetical protein